MAIVKNNEEWEIHYQAGKEDERRKILKIIDVWMKSKGLRNIEELMERIKGENEQN